MRCDTFTEAAMHAFMRRRRKGYGYDSLWNLGAPQVRETCAMERRRAVRNKGLGQGAKCVMAGHGHWRQEVLPCCL